MNIHQRLLEVMKEVHFIQKDTRVTGGGSNYTAVSHDQVISTVRPSLINKGILITASQKSGEVIVKRDPDAGVKMHLYSGEYEISFINCEKPEDKITVTVQAHAADNGDKAPGKCLTYATKQAILKTLYIETGDNEESREEFRDRVRQESKPSHYSDEEFQKNFAAWAGCIQSGKHTAEQVIARASAKAPLTEQQKQQIRAVETAQGAAA